MFANFRLPKRQPKAKRLLKNFQGSFLQSPGGKWHIAYTVPLVHAYDWLLEEDTDRARAANEALYRALLNHDAHADVLPLPVSEDERVQMILALEQPSPKQQHDPTWWPMRELEARKLAAMLARSPGGDWEPHGFLFVELDGVPDESTLLEEEFWAMFRLDRHNLLEFEYANLLSAVEQLTPSLQAVFPGITPADPGLLNKALIQMSWPGIPKVEEVDDREEETKSSRGAQSFLGIADIEEDRYVLKFDYFGRESYATCLPLKGPAIYMPDSSKLQAYGFLSVRGRRLRFTRKFSVRPGTELLRDAGNKLRDVKNHAKRHMLNDGLEADYRTNIQTAAAFYDYLSDGEPVVKARTMIIVTAPTRRELVAVREEAKQAIVSRGFRSDDDNWCQRELFLASFPGASHFNRYFRTMGIGQAAAAMPFVTSAPRPGGPALMGRTMGVEVRPVFSIADAALREGRTTAPAICLHGPSGMGKTTWMVDMLIPLAQRREVVHLYDQAKGDLRLLDASQLPPGLDLQMIDLSMYKGCLNPVLLCPVGDPEHRDDRRASAIADLFRMMCGQRWSHSWDKALQTACYRGLMNAYAEAPGEDPQRVIPDLYRIIRDLVAAKGGYEGELELGLCLRDATMDREVADITCSNKYPESLLDRMSEPGMHIIQLSGVTFPDKDIDPKEYTPAQNLAMATFVAANSLSFVVSRARETRVAIGFVEFSRTSKLSRGSNLAEHMARTGRAYGTIVLFDTQLGSDLSPELQEQITTWIGFTPTREPLVRASLELMGLGATDRHVAQFTDLTNPLWTSPPSEDGVNKGAAAIRMPGAKPVMVCVQNPRYYVTATAFRTDQSERKTQAKPPASSPINGAAHELVSN